MHNSLDYDFDEDYQDEEVEDDDETTTAIEYRFCHSTPTYLPLKSKLETLSENSLLDVLRNASDQHFNFDEYEKLGTRREIRAIAHIIMNERGIAPEFRNAKSGVSHRAKYFPDEAQESNDRQVIDLHWLYLHHRDVIRPDASIKGLFQGSKFDFDAASSFVAAAGGVPKKINRLGIPTKIQKLLLSLRKQDIYSTQKYIRSKTADVRELLIDRMYKPKSKLPKHALEAVCAAFRCLLMADGSPLDAVEFWQKQPSTLKQQSPDKVLPWMKSRKAFLTKLLGAVKWDKPS